MIVENGHAHAYTRGEPLDWKDYLLLSRSALECKIAGYKSVTVHLPYEIQHPEFRDIKKGHSYMTYGESVKRVLSINLYWENAPLLDHENWSLKYGNTDWTHVPHNVDLCLDTGHLMLGCQNKEQFLEVLKKLMETRGPQIKFLHFHENDLISDNHDPVPGRIITK